VGIGSTTFVRLEMFQTSSKSSRYITTSYGYGFRIWNDQWRSDQASWIWLSILS